MSDDASPAVTDDQRGSSTLRQANSPRRLSYRERLYLSWWSWPLPLLGATLLAAEAHMGYPGLRSWLPYLIMLPLAVAMLLALGRVKIEVIQPSEVTPPISESSGDHPGAKEAQLRVGAAHIPLRHIGTVEVIDRDHKRKALGPNLDPAAFVCHRGWIGPVLRVEVTDPRDPTPYWLFSTRKPTQLAEALTSGNNH